MSRWQVLTKTVQIEIRAFLFFTVLFSLFRLAFIIFFSEQLASVGIKDIGEAMLLGLRLSLKSTGVIVLLSVVVADTPQQLWLKWPAQTIRRFWYGFMTVVLTFLFAGRLPFYRIFNSGYNMLVINGKNDGIKAILKTGVEQYHAIPLSLGALAVSAISVLLLYRVLNCSVRTAEPPESRTRKVLLAVGGILFFLVFCVFIRYGGGFSYAHSVNWENAARLPSNFLNEAVLDDIQALYRVRSIHKRMSKLSSVSLTSDEVRSRIAAIGGNGNADGFDEAFTRIVTTERLREQPRSVTVILGESYGLWPFLAAYDEPGAYIAREGRRLAADEHSMSPAYALAQGTGTMPAINGLLTGMPDVGLYPNYEPQSYKSAYGLGIGSVMKHLGYKTVFWYGGFSTWQDVKKMALAQNFDEFHDASEMQSDEENAWGVADGALFRAVETYMTAHKGEKILNVIMTTSNHPPYSVPVEKEGFDADKVHGHVPDSIADTPEQVNEMGHFWYADHVMGEFVDTLRRQDPTALFVITGDHSERFSFVRDVGPGVASTIPLIFYGQGIRKDWIASDSTGMSIQMIPTLAELVGRPGETYMSMVPSLFEKERFVFNHRLWADDKGIFEQNDRMPGAYKDKIRIMRELTAWRIKHGNRI